MTGGGAAYAARLGFAALALAACSEAGAGGDQKAQHAGADATPPDASVQVVPDAGSRCSADRASPACAIRKPDASAGSDSRAPAGGATDSGAKPPDAATTEGGPRRDPIGAPLVEYTGATLGDPHLMTLDGVLYDLQGVGEFVLLESGSSDFAIQLRTTRYFSNPFVTVVDRAALRIGADRFVVAADGTTTLNGTPAALPDGRTALPGGGQVFRGGPIYVLVLPDTSQVRITTHGSRLGVEVFVSAARRGSLGGLLGDFDGDDANDLRAHDGSILAEPPSFSDFYGTFIESWRVSPPTSLFDYGTGESTETFTDRSFPRQPAIRERLSLGAAASTATYCTNAGVEKDWLDACVVDLGYTADSSFIDDLRNAPHGRRAVALPYVPVPGSIEDRPDGSPADGIVSGPQSWAGSVYLRKGQTVDARVFDLLGNRFHPQIEFVDAAAGNTVAGGSGDVVAAVSYTAESSGTFNVEVINPTGGRSSVLPYRLNLVTAPGARNAGPLQPGDVYQNVIAEGDLIASTFFARTGDHIELHLADEGSSTGTFVSAMEIYDPTGARLGLEATDAGVTSAFDAPASGTYTVVMSDGSPGHAASGGVSLRFDRTPASNDAGAP